MKQQKAGKSRSEKPRSDQSEPRRKANVVGAGKAPRPVADAGEANVVVPTDNGNNLPEGQNIALSERNSALSSVKSTATVNPVQEKNTMATLKFRKTDKSGSSSFSIEGVKSSVYFNKGMFAGEPPQTLEINLPDGFAFAEPGARPAAGATAMTPEQRAAAAAQRKAELAAMTPAQRAQLKVENAQKALEAAQKAAAKAAAGPSL